MSVFGVDAAAGVVPLRKQFWRPATVLTALASVTLFLLLARHVIDDGYLRKDVAALEAGDAWQTGGWLSLVVLRVVTLVQDRELRQTALSLFAAVVSGLALGALYDSLRANGWRVVGALLVLVALGLHAGELYTVTASSRAIPLYIAFAVLIPCIRSMEDVGDVQSAIGLGLVLPLLLLASPITTLLIGPLAVCAALTNPDGRSDARAFVAMLLVAVLPTLIVAAGIVGFVAQSGFDIADILLPYANAYGGLHWGDATASLAALAIYAPVMIVPVVYCFWPRLTEKRHILSALAIVVLPLCLVLARVVLNTTMTAIVPPLALIACFVSWLATVRLPIALRVFALAMLVLSAALSWTHPELWEDAAWKSALLSVVPDGIGNLALRSGI